MASSVRPTPPTPPQPPTLDRPPSKPRKHLPTQRRSPASAALNATPLRCASVLHSSNQAKPLRFQRPYSYAENARTPATRQPGVSSLVLGPIRRATWAKGPAQASLAQARHERRPRSQLFVIVTSPPAGNTGYPRSCCQIPSADRPRGLRRCRGRRLGSRILPCRR